MSDKKVLLSVVIPTYNRYMYLKDCLRCLSSIKSEQLEVVVQDNTENNEEILPILEELNDERIKYHHEPVHMSIVDNADLAVKNSSGQYVTMIGDDDTICETMLDAVRFCIDNDIEACCCSYPVFNWPDVTFVERKKEAMMHFYREADGTVWVLDGKKGLEKCLKIGGMLLEYEMPRLYHGLVSRACLDRIYDKAGSFFPGPSPDISNATAVCIESKKSAYINDYLMVSGIGHFSNRDGGKYTHYGKPHEKPWLAKNIKEIWDKELPYIFSSEMIYAESILEALKAMKEPEYIKKFDYGSSYARFLWHHKEARIPFFFFGIRRPHRLIKALIGFYRCKVNRINYGENFHEIDNIDSLAGSVAYTMELRSKIKELKWR